MSLESPNEPASGDSPPTTPVTTLEPLRAYIDANASKYTDEALSAELLKAGYAQDDIQAALLDSRARGVAVPPRARAIATITIAYGVTFALLAMGMLANAGSLGNGCCAPSAFGGIVLLAGSLGIALILSMLWVGSGRASVLVLAALIGIPGIVQIGNGVIAWSLIVAAIVLALLVARHKPGPPKRSTATLASLVAIPVILLVIISGICLASGLPIPHGA
jgi:hypothetical protein